jgi:anti-sigma B factor antagonist
MNLRIEQRERQRVVILDLKGWLVLGEEDLFLLQRLLFLLDSRHRQVILNLKEVSNIDESGLDTVAFCATRFHDVGGRLVLLNIGPSHAKVADISKLSTVSETYQEETEAVNSFFPDRVVPRYDILEFVNAQKAIRESKILKRGMSELGSGGRPPRLARLVALAKSSKLVRSMASASW